ncbi:hypothetical protein BS47DRAFT_1347467 [Hydnum rufescens UP504]|uniref:F-box domain-containing protein n=1 Tax=Hydnum rufescens UP504 TaxID=1448309 RepID=A0A9P6AU17_9AGAM|nr:hypothetical protein BS47DRAFT_1347467 [Hydnum rufescens UP504]
MQNLPVEAVLRIFSFLDGQQIARCAEVCAYFKDMITRSTAMQYAIKLAMYGYSERHDDRVLPKPVTTRINQLECHIRAWNNLDWVESLVTIPNAQFRALSGGIFVHVGLDVVTCVQLPSFLRDIPLRTWTMENPVDVDFINCVAVDASQDLFVIFHQSSNSLHSFLRLQSLSDSVPHPRAALSVLELWVTPTPVRQQFKSMVQIIGHLLGVFHYFDAAVLQIWDWSAGHRVASLQLGSSYWERAMPLMSSASLPFTFLSGSSFIIPTPGAVDVYQFSPGSWDATPTRIASFRLPPEDDGAFRWIKIEDASTIQEALSSLYGSSDHDILSHHPPSSRLPGNLLGAASNCQYIRLSRRTYSDSEPGVVHVMRLHAPLHVFRRSATFEDPLQIPWDTWSQGIYRDRRRTNLGHTGNPTESHLLHTGRIIDVAHPHRMYESGQPTWVSLLDFNQNRVDMKVSRSEPYPMYGFVPSLHSSFGGSPNPPLMLVALRSYLNDSLWHQEWTESWLDDEHIMFMEGGTVELAILTVSPVSSPSYSTDTVF